MGSLGFFLTGASQKWWNIIKSKAQKKAAASGGRFTAPLMRQGAGPYQGSTAMLEIVGSWPPNCHQVCQRILSFFGQLRCLRCRGSFGSKTWIAQGAILCNFAVLDSKRILQQDFSSMTMILISYRVVWPPVTLNWCSHDTGDCWHWHLSSCIVRAVSGLTAGRLF